MRKGAARSSLSFGTTVCGGNGDVILFADGDDIIKEIDGELSVN